MSKENNNTVTKAKQKLAEALRKNLMRRKAQKKQQQNKKSEK